MTFDPIPTTNHATADLPAAAPRGPGTRHRAGPADPGGDGPGGDGPATLCPRCGYDLRGSASGRCSECGLRVDAAGLAVSGVPWAHRRRVGRVRAFLKTTWMVVMDTWALRREMAKPQDPRDADRFGWCVGTLAAAGLLAGWGIGVYEGGLDAYAPDFNPSAFSGSPASVGGGKFPSVPGVGSGLLQDAIVPWAAGLAAWPVLPLCLVALAFYLVGVPRAALRLGRFPPGHQAKGRALATYAAAPLALLAVAGGLAWAVYALSHRPETNSFQSPIQLAFYATDILLFLTVLTVAVAGPMRAAQWRARARHGGLGVTLLSAVEVVVRAAVGVAVWLGFFPWVVGYVWLFVDSLR